MQRPKTYTVDEAQKAMEKYCAYQERCHQEVRKKLQSMQMIPEAIDHIIVHLIQHNFLNESRFVQAFVQGKFNNKKWGKLRLYRELKGRDIPKTVIERALQEIPDAKYLKTFNELAEKQVSKIKETNPWKKKRKLADYLLYRGWESHLVYDKVNELISQRD